MMKWSISLIGHHSRVDMAETHLRKIMQDCPEARVKVFIDYEDRGLRWNFWRAIQDDTFFDDDFRTILQEDAMPCKDFYQSIGVAYQALVHAKGYTLPQFYSNTKDVERAIAKGHSWLKTNIVWGPCLTAPLSFFRGMVKWADDPAVQDSFGELRHKFLCKKPTFDDEFVFTHYAEETGAAIYFSVPTLCQHVGRERSTLGHKPKGNKGMTRWFIGEDVSGLTIDWSKV